MKTNDKKYFIKGKLDCFILVFQLKWPKVILKMTDLFFQLQDYNSWWKHCSAKHEWQLKTVLYFSAKIRTTSVNLSWILYIFWSYIIVALHDYLLFISLSFTFQFFNCYNNTIIEIRGHSQIENSVLNVDPKSESWLPPPNLDANVYFWPQQSSTFVLLLTLPHKFYFVYW